MKREIIEEFTDSLACMTEDLFEDEPLFLVNFYYFLIRRITNGTWYVLTFKMNRQRKHSNI